MPPSCPTELRSQVSETFYFGTAKPQGVVSAKEWSDFLAEVVTPRFPQGLTVWPAAGQWRGEDGRIVHEASFVLRLVHSGSAKEEAAVQTIASEYKKRFEQEAVLREHNQVCVGF
jgi:hypothetical protein